VDISPEAIAARPHDLGIISDAAPVLTGLAGLVSVRHRNGAARAMAARRAARAEIGPVMAAQLDMLEVIRVTVPGALIVGDSTQPVYAGNLYYDHDRPGGWFNAATGYGALGFGIPAAIGAALGCDGDRVICLTGDGGAQFSLAEMMVAVEEAIPLTFVVWNNRGYREIAESMAAAGTEVIGCNPIPPDFGLLAASFGMEHQAIEASPAALAGALRSAAGPRIVEIRVK
jgi:acetolactate synthase-1/2/3 large subunit